MSDWWIDDAPYPGPPVTRSLSEIMADVMISWQSMDRAVINLQLHTGRQLNNSSIDEAVKKFAAAASAPNFYFDGYRLIEIAQKLEPYYDAAQNLQDTIISLDEETKKRNIGKGIVEGHGPRSKTTFGRGGRKQY